MMTIGGIFAVGALLAVLAGVGALLWRLRSSLPHPRLLPPEPEVVAIERWDTALAAERARELLAAKRIASYVWLDEGPEYAYRGRRPGAYLEVKAADAERALALLHSAEEHRHARRSTVRRR